MLMKLYRCVVLMYKFLATLNLAWSLLALNWFYLTGFQHAKTYFIAFFIKLSGYMLSLVIERLFLTDRHYFIYNQGIGLRRLFSFLFIADFLVFTVFTLFLWMIKAFI